MFQTIVFVVVGLVAAISAGVARRALRRWPRHRSCPSCRAPTSALRSEGLILWVPWLVRRRWCAACGWAGLSNPSPPPGGSAGDLGHDSGFRWSARFRDRTGFRWSVRNRNRMGFRWSPVSRPREGFRWADPPGPGEDGPPGGFSWAESPGTATRRRASFRWRGTPRDASPPTPHPDDFRFRPRD